MRPIALCCVDLIGLPWRLGACGPDAYDCWGLLREVMRRAGGAALPASAADAGGWARRERLVPGDEPLDGDIALMSTQFGERHVGVVLVDLVARPSLVHAVQRVGVCMDPLQALPALGMADVRLFRRPR